MTDDSTDYFAAFICIRGDVDNLGLNQEGCFALRDARGQDWICWQANRESMQSDFERVVHDTTVMQKRLLQNGYSGTGGTNARLFVLHLPEPITWEEQLDRLRERLGESDDQEEEWKKSQ